MERRCRKREVSDMGYRKPEEVIAPKSRWELGTILCNTGHGGWSASEGKWDSEPALGIRWNGDDDSGSHGNPQSHGNPTWFIVPAELEDAVRREAQRINEALSLVHCEITRPEDFDYGVFRIEVEVSGPLGKTIAGRDIPFEMPRLLNRFFRPEKGYWTHPANDETQPRGLIKDRKWFSIVQTNGFSEENNPTRMKIVEDTLLANILQALRPFKLPEIHNSRTARAV
jgi:hypothetical protein